ncbi:MULTISPECIES: photosystem II protein, Psb35-related [Leptolyngbya]|uniref:photosystem II protein, Psb35-related n=1 Tax=Leptolyngbya TaxID=47251 RepID=UPI0016882E5D|nr:hypothetical protein [Leptolyngbya sp. FACHB-1624]MBD1855691.1 hypothetical protein [Leptolyngbya sp. FACHB-1624]
MVILISLFVVGWVAVALLGSMTYFLGEQSKPIHERNWRSTSFEKLARALTGNEIDYSTRVPAFVVADAYASARLPEA